MEAKIMTEQCIQSDVIDHNLKLNSETSMYPTMKEFCKLQKEVEEIRLHFNNVVAEVKKSHAVELENHNKIIYKLQTRINGLERKSAINDFMMEHHEVNVDNNE